MERVEGAQVVMSPATALVLVSVMIAVAVSAGRIVPTHERMVVTRWGRVVRVAGPGLAMRVPAVERWQAVSLQPSRVQLGVSALTVDGVPVHAQVSAVLRVTEPADSSNARPSVQVAAQSALEALVARELGRARAGDLLRLRLSLESAIEAELEATTTAFGVRVAEVEMRDIEVVLTMALLESLRGGALPLPEGSG